MWRADSLEKCLVLGKTEGNRRREWQRMRWLDSITLSGDMNLSNLWEMVEGRGVCCAADPKSWTRLSRWTTAGWIWSLYQNLKGVSKARRKSDWDNGKNQKRLRSVSSMSNMVQLVPGLEELICGGVILAHESKSHWIFPWILECSCIDWPAFQLAVTYPAVYFFFFLSLRINTVQ